MNDQEILEMQGLPLMPDSVETTGLKFPPFNADVISASAKRRLAGNSFNQPCMTAFMAFLLARLVPRDHEDSDMESQSDKGS